MNTWVYSQPGLASKRALRRKALTPESIFFFRKGK
jgi:hypothetical protein